LKDINKLIFGFFLKTFRGDFNYVDRLIQSFNKHNKDNIKMYLMCSLTEIVLFEKFESENIKIINEEKLGHYLVNNFSINNIRPGYINQCILKLSFWELGLLENYFCIDSEAVFIDDFYLKDFIAENDAPYSFLIEDNELKVDPEYNESHGIERDKSLKNIKKYLELNKQILLTNHGHCTLSSLVLRNFKNQVLIKNKISYKDLLKISPYEFSWYNFYLQKTKLIEIIAREPIIKVFHNYKMYNDYLSKNITIEDIKRGYKAYLINSNFSRESGEISYGEKVYVPTFSEILLLTKSLFNLMLNKFKHMFI